MISLVAGVLDLVGGGFSLLVIMWVIGLFWVAAGLLELLTWFQSRGPAVQWPWISGLILLVGVVMVTFPNLLVPILTVLGSAWAIVLGVVHLVRWLWLSLHADHLVMPTNRPSLLRRILLVGIPAVLLAVPVLGYGKVLVTSATENARQALKCVFDDRVQRAILPPAPSFGAIPGMGDLLSRSIIQWCRKPGRSIVELQESRPRFTSSATVEQLSSLPQVFRSPPCVSRWGIATCKVPCSMQKWIRPPSSKTCWNTNGTRES